VQLLHDSHAISVRLDVLDGRNKPTRSNVGRTRALFRTLFDLSKGSRPGWFVERRGSLRPADEVDGGNLDPRQIKGDELHPQTLDHVQRLFVISPRRQLSRSLARLTFKHGSKIADAKVFHISRGVPPEWDIEHTVVFPVWAVDRVEDDRTIFGRAAERA